MRGSHQRWPPSLALSSSPTGGCQEGGMAPWVWGGEERGGDTEWSCSTHRGLERVKVEGVVLRGLK